MEHKLGKEDTALMITLVVRNIAQIYELSFTEELTEIEVAEFIHCNKVMDQVEGSIPPINDRWDSYHEARIWYDINYKNEGALC